uniref:Predicted protein n=1 Tax=Hordeum vulgare subsp. vulgare TaxID=112509 RepID=F2E7A6_HORVV|nr:predicted protein [Hordeum vulgare subsp. vulgare]
MHCSPFDFKLRRSGSIWSSPPLVAGDLAQGYALVTPSRSSSVVLVASEPLHPSAPLHLRPSRGQERGHRHHHPASLSSTSSPVSSRALSLEEGDDRWAPTFILPPTSLCVKPDPRAGLNDKPTAPTPLPWAVFMWAG